MRRIADIRIIITGGTLEKEYDPVAGRLVLLRSGVARALKEARCRIDVAIEPLMMVDSAEMNEDCRNQIARACARSPEERIVITHGTDTMVNTAELIAGHALKKTIVLTGSMIPLRVVGSDGNFNIGAALAFVQTLAHGVYVAMNGRIFLHDDVRKDRQAGYFEAAQ